MPKKSSDKLIQSIEMTEIIPMKKSLAQLRNKINKKSVNGNKAVMASDKNKIIRIPSGILEIDNALGGGFAVGRIVLLAGGESSYKSTICLRTIVEVQKRGGTAAWVDAERAFNKDWAIAQGVDLEQLLILEPETAEEAYNLMTDCILEGVDILVLDSLNTLVVRKEMFADEKGLEAASIEKNAMGVPQKLASQWFRTAMGRIDKAGTLMLVISQMRDNLNAGMYGNPNVIVGGRAVKFAASMILMTRIVGGKDGRIMDKGDKQIGQKYEVKVEKSRFGGANKVAEFTAYGAMIDNFSSMLKIGMDRGFIERIGTKTYICREKNYNGKGAMMQALHDDQELFTWCMNKVQEAMDVSIFSFNPYSKDDVDAKAEALIAAKEHIQTDEDGIMTPEEDDDSEEESEE